MFVPRPAPSHAVNCMILANLLLVVAGCGGGGGLSPSPSTSFTTGRRFYRQTRQHTHTSAIPARRHGSSRRILQVGDRLKRRSLCARIYLWRLWWPQCRPSNESGDVFIQSFDSELSRLDAMQFGTLNEERGYLALRVGALYFGGTTKAVLVSGSEGSFDGFVLRLDPATLELE